MKRLPIRRPHRFFCIAVRGMAVCAMSVLPWETGVALAQKAAIEQLPAPERRPTRPDLSPSAPYQSEKPHRVTNITLQDADLNDSAPADLSTNLFYPAANPDSRQTRGWAATEYAWTATCIAYHPLYFEQPAAERYGQTLCPCVQPALSVGQFYGAVLALPGLIVLDCPWDCHYAYGYPPPGSPGQ